MSANEAETDAEAAVAASPLSKGADRIRDSAKWLIASFAAVGALLIAGLQIADIGDLSGRRLFWALCGIALGVLGVVIAIAAASSVVTESFVTLHWLAGRPAPTEPRASIDGDQVLLGGFSSVSELETEYKSAAGARITALKTYYRTPNTANASALATANNWVLALDRITNNVIDRASFLKVAKSYRNARFGILFGAAVTAIGIATFAWASNPPESTPPASVVEKTPTNVTVVIRKPNKTLATKLGKRCDLGAVKAVAIADIGANYQVSSIPTAKCKAALFVVTPAVGRIVLPTEDEPTSSTQSGS